MKRKGIINLLNIWKRFTDKYPNSTLLLVGPDNVKSTEGDKSYIKRLNQLTDKYGLKQKIKFIGETENVVL